VWVTGTIDFDANMSFHTYFKNVHLTLVKSAPEKSFAKKTVFLALLWGAYFIK